MEHKYLSLQVEYNSTGNTTHILAYAVLIKDYKCTCVSAIPSMLAYLVSFISLSHDTQNVHAPTLHTDL